MKNRRKNLIAALMVINISCSWAQKDPVPVDRNHHSIAPWRNPNNVKHGQKSVTAPAKAAVDMEAMPGMDHNGMDDSRMKHDSTPGMDQNDKTGAAQNFVHDMNHGVASSGKAGNMSRMNHGGGESMSMQGDSAPPGARDPHAYSDGYDFGPIPRPQMGDEDLIVSLLVDRLESATTRGITAMTYDWQAWFGNTYDRALIRAERNIEGGFVYRCPQRAALGSRHNRLLGHAIGCSL
jgi:copper resistance protein B